MKFLHTLLKGLSLTGALFVFQACYGVPQTTAIPEPEEIVDTELGSVEVSGSEGEGVAQGSVPVLPEMPAVADAEL